MAKKLFISLKKWIFVHRYGVLAFVIPYLVMQLAYIALSVYPFGSNTILTIDMYHQYAPFFSLLQEKLTTGGSLFYSWDTGIGTNFWGLIGYYLASPFNLLFAVFPRAWLTECMAFVTMLKTGLIGLTFYLYTKNVWHKGNLSNILFGTCFALCNYMVAYNWNMMWLDAIAMMPLALWGLERLLAGKRPWLYCISLGIAIFSNFYVAFMVAVYIVFYFFAHCFVRKNFFWKCDFWVKVGRFALYSILAGGISAFLSLPTYLALKTIASLEYSAPAWDGSMLKLWELIPDFLSFCEPALMSGLPNLACGLLPLMMIPVYWTSSAGTREKIASTALLAVITVFFQSRYLNYALHGFHYPNSLDHRFAFLFVFTMLVMAWRGFTLLEERKPKLCGWLAIGMLGVIIFSEYAAKDGKLTMIMVYANIAMCIAYAAILSLYLMHKIPKLACYMLALFLTTVELLIQWPLYRGAASRATDYVQHSKISEVMNSVEQLDDDFYRVEKLEPYWTSNDSAWFGYKGVSQFNSMAYSGAAIVMRYLGLSNNGLNSFFQDSSLPTFNSIMGVRYLVTNQPIESGSVFEEVSVKDGYYTYRNPYALSLGYCVNSDLLYWEIGNHNTFDLQNQFLQLATGEEGPLKSLITSNYTAKAMTIKPANISGWYDGYYFDRDGTGDGTATCQIMNDKEQNVFLYIATKNSQEIRSVTAVINGERRNITYGENHVIALGICPAGPIQLEMAFNSSDTGYFMVSACSVDYEKLDNVMNLLAQGNVTFTTTSDTYFEGSFTAQRDGALFFSFPYDVGWKVTIDGEAVETLDIGDGFLGVNVTAGEHTVTMRYRPDGFVAGVAITAISLAVLVGLEFVRRYHEKKQKRVQRIVEQLEKKEHVLCQN